MIQNSPAGAPTIASLRRQVLIGISISAFLVVGLGGWAATAELSGAVIAPGTVVVETNLKKVQHPTGGIVGEILVRDGMRVKAGDVLIRLDETVTRANLAVVTKSLDELEGRRARLEAERDGAGQVDFPTALTIRAAGNPDVGKIVAGEDKLFTARREARRGQSAQLRQRIAQLGQEVEGLEAQRIALSDQILLIAKELMGVEELYAKSLVTISRVAALQREAARLEGERGRVIASIAQAKGKGTETELQILQLEQDFVTEALRELRELDAKVGELVERKVAGEDQLKRINITSPRHGFVHQMSIHTIGGVISAGEPLMYIVPEHEKLIIEARISPTDIDQVHPGQYISARFTAFNQRTTPIAKGIVTHISSDTAQMPNTNEMFYILRADINEYENTSAIGTMLIPGMPVELHIGTQPRTALSYLAKPFADHFARAWRED